MTLARLMFGASLGDSNRHLPFSNGRSLLGNELASVDKDLFRTTTNLKTMYGAVPTIDVPLWRASPLARRVSHPIPPFFSLARPDAATYATAL